jgi:hypothetical protein
VPPDNEHGLFAATTLVDVGTIEPGIMSNILARIDKPARDGLRAATNAYRTLVNSWTLQNPEPSRTVHVGPQPTRCN